MPWFNYYFAASAAVNAVVSTILGLFVFFYNRKSPTHRTLALFCFGVAIWSYPYILWPLYSSYTERLLSFQLLHIGACFVSIFYLHFVINWLNLYEQKKKLIAFGYLISSLFALTTFSEYFITEMVPKFSIGFWANPGPLYHWYLVMFFGFFFYASYLLIKKFIQSVGNERKQAGFLLLGICLAFIGGSTNYFLWYDINIMPFGNGLVVFYVILSVYSIIKHRLMDIKLVLRRYAVYLTSILTIAAPAILIQYSTDKFWPQFNIFSEIVLLITGISLFPVLKEKYYRFANQYLFSSLYDSQDVISKINDKLKMTIELNKIYQAISQTLSDNLRIGSFFLIFKPKKATKMQISFNKGFREDVLKGLINDATAEKLLLKTKEQLVLDEDFAKLGSANKAYYEKFKNLNFKFIAPLHLKNDNRAWLILGPKESKDSYNDEDEQVLEIITTEISIAIENSMLYDETLKFNVTLKKRVDEATAKLRVQNEELKKIDEMKSEFVSVASHQLRTPLTATKWALGSLKKEISGTANKNAKDALKDLSATNEKLIKLVNELLNIARIDEGRLSIKPEPSDLSAIVKSCLQDLLPLIEKKKLKLIEKYDKLPLIPLDKNVVSKAIANILSNAVKYNRTAKKLQIEIKKENNQALLRISDEGIGIPQGEHGQIFKKFYRASNATESSAEGTGLGLYITKNSIELSGGKVYFTSQENKGTTFCISLPLTGSKNVEGEKSLV